MEENEIVINESKIYRLEEMHDEMQQGIKNVENIITDQTHLVETLEEIERPEFGPLISSMKEQIENMKEQVSILSERKKELFEVLEISKENETVTKVLDKLIIALGLFKD